MNPLKKSLIFTVNNVKFRHLISGSGRSARDEIGYPLQYSWAFLVAQLVKKLPAMWETWVQFLGGKYPLEKQMATHSLQDSGLQSMGLQKVRRDFHFHFYCNNVQYLSLNLFVKQ